MSYKALYRTYRPQTFDEIAGQKQIVQTLKNAIKEEKIAHAYLFTGPRGTGKTTMAKLLAKALNCSGENKPCDECENCLAISEGSYPDVIEIDAASNNGVDEVRNLIDKVKYAPLEGKYKVYIIDEVHMMSQGAFNALLKTLEEPPAHVVFVLATTEPHKVLPTILSRCQRFDFGRISRKDIEDRLVNVLLSENIDYEDGVVELVSELCDGGMRDALSILDQAIAYAGTNITKEDIRTIYGIVSNEEKIEFIKFLNGENYQELLNKINEYDEKGIDLSRLTNNLIEVLKEVIIHESSDSFKGLTVLNVENYKQIENLTSNTAFKMIDVLVEALTLYKKAGGVRALFEISCLKICGLNKKQERIIYKEIVKEVEKPAENITKVQENENKVFIENKNIEEVSENKIVNIEKEEKPIEVENKREERVAEEVKESENENVSYETFEEKQEIPVNNNVEVSEEELLNVLVQASKEALLKAKQQWVKLPKYLSSASTGKVTSVLLDGNPVAACDNVIIIAYANDVYLNRVFVEGNYDEMNNFLKALYNSDMKCYCLTMQNFINLKEKYMTLRQLGKLPKPVPIVIQRRNVMVNDVKETEVDEGVEYARKLFGDNVIIKED